MTRSIARGLLATAIAWAIDPAVGTTAEAPTAPAQTLRVGVFDFPSIVHFDGERPTGLAIDLWREIADRMGVRTEFVREKDIESLLADTAEGKIDVLLGPLAVTEAREKLVDFSHSVLTSGMRIAVLERRKSGWFSSVLSLLSRELLTVAAAVVALVIVTAHVLWFFERWRNPQAFPTSYFEGVWEALWWSVSTIVTGGCEDKPINTFAGRMVALVWMFGGITLVATLTGTIAAKMTADQIAGVIHGPRDLAGRTVGIMHGSVAEQSVRSRGGSLLEFATLAEAFKAAASGEVEAVVHENHILQTLVSRPENTAFRLVGPVFDIHEFAMAVPPGSPLRESLSTTILALREDGTLDTMVEKAFGPHD